MDKVKASKNGSLEKTPILVDPKDPINSILGVFEKKIRNLEKRKLKGIQLQGLLDSGKTLNPDQLVSVAQMHGVMLCLDMLQDLTKSLSTIKDSFPIPEPSKPTTTSPRSSTSDKEDTIKEVVEMQKRFQKLVDYQDQIKALKSTDDKLLKDTETDILLAFWTPLSSHKSYGSWYKSKKPILTIRQFIDKEPKTVGPHCLHTFAEVYKMYEKINPTVFAITSKPKSKQIVVPVVSSPSTPEVSNDKIIQISVSNADLKVVSKKSKIVETNGQVELTSRKSNAVRSPQSKSNAYSNKKNSVQSPKEKPSAISLKSPDQAKIVVTDIPIKAKTSNPRTQQAEVKKSTTLNKYRNPHQATTTSTA